MLSEYVPFACSQIRCHDLVGFPSDLCVGVPVEDFEAFSHMVFVARRRAITHIMEDLFSNCIILIPRQLEQSVPEVRLVALYPAWAHLLSGFQSDLTVFVHGKCDDFLNAFGFADLSKLFTDVFICGRLRLLLVVDLGPLVRHFVYQLYLSKLDLDHSLICEILSQSYHCI